MPVNIRTRQMAVKDPSTGEYDAFDAIAINNTKNRIAEIDAAAKKVLDSLPAEYTDTVERVDGLERTLIRNEASGEIASFNDGADDLPIDSLKIRLEPQQDLHGYDHPWPGGGGENKFNPSFDAFTERNLYAGQLIGTGNGESVTLTVFDKDTSVDVSGVYFGLSKNGINAQEGVIWISNGQSILSSRTVTRTDMPYVTIFPKTEETLNKILARFDVVAGISETAYTSFIPYSNICPITGHTETKVSRTGKNLCDPSVKTSKGNFAYWYSENDGFLAKKDVTYTISMYVPSTGGSDNTIALYAKGKDGTVIPGVSKPVVSFTLDEDKLVYFYAWQSGGINLSDVQLQVELGSTATDYEPYQGETYDIAFPSEAGTVYGGTLDISTGKLVVDRAIIQLNGTEGWRMLGQVGSNRRFDMYLNRFPSIIVSSWVSDTFRLGSAPSGTDNLFGTYYFYSTTNLCINDKEGNFSTLADFTAWLAENTPSFVADLATPITYTLTASQIRTLLGQNHIFASNGSNVDVKYKADTKIYIDNKFSELSALIANL